MTYSLLDLNKTAEPLGLELVKGQGYFYWVPNAINVHIPSVYVAAFCHVSRDVWEAELMKATDALRDAGQASSGVTSKDEAPDAGLRRFLANTTTQTPNSTNGELYA